jgi:hypothetical protein
MRDMIVIDFYLICENLCHRWMNAECFHLRKSADICGQILLWLRLRRAVFFAFFCG